MSRPIKSGEPERCAKCREKYERIEERLERVRDFGVALQDFPIDAEPETAQSLLMAVGIAIEHETELVRSEHEVAPFCEHEKSEPEFPRPVSPSVESH